MMDRELRELLGEAVDTDRARFDGGAFADAAGGSVATRVKRRRAVRTAGIGSVAAVSVGAIALGATQLPWGRWSSLAAGYCPPGSIAVTPESGGIDGDPAAAGGAAMVPAGILYDDMTYRDDLHGVTVERAGSRLRFSLDGVPGPGPAVSFDVNGYFTVGSSRPFDHDGDGTYQLALSDRLFAELTYEEADDGVVVRVFETDPATPAGWLAWAEPQPGGESLFVEATSGLAILFGDDSITFTSAEGLVTDVIVEDGQPYQVWNDPENGDPTPLSRQPDGSYAAVAGSDVAALISADDDGNVDLPTAQVWIEREGETVGPLTRAGELPSELQPGAASASGGFIVTTDGKGTDEPSSVECVTPTPTPPATPDPDPTSSWAARDEEGMSPFECGFEFSADESHTDVIEIPTTAWLDADDASALIAAPFEEPETAPQVDESARIATFDVRDRNQDSDFGGASGPDDPSIIADSVMVYLEDDESNFVQGVAVVLVKDRAVVGTLAPWVDDGDVYPLWSGPVGSSVDVERYFLIQPEGAFIACEGATLDDTELWAVAGAGIITGAGVVEGFDYAWRRIGPPA